MTINYGQNSIVHDDVKLRPKSVMTINYADVRDDVKLRRNIRNGNKLWCAGCVHNDGKLRQYFLDDSKLKWHILKDVKLRRTSTMM